MTRPVVRSYGESPPRYENWQILSLSVVVRFGTHVCGGDTVSRCLRINNPTAFGKRTINTMASFTRHLFPVGDLRLLSACCQMSAWTGKRTT